MKRYTINDMLDWHPCERYTKESLKDLMGRKKSVSLIEILTCDISDNDAIWAACRAMDDRARRHFACDCAESVLHLAPDPRSTEAVRVARLFADGKATDEELAAARDAAWAAARDAARDAAWAAARDAAWAAAWDAARDAAWAAAWDAAWAAARDAAWDAARQALLVLALSGEIE
jgi:hypothetical protein